MKQKIFLVFLFFLAFFLRFYRLGAIPPSPDWDEAALGYNAYSILKTGRDEYGSFMPLVFRSFDDYKPPLYIYLTVPSVLVFGLNVFAVRLPSALLGTFTVLLIYLLVEKLFASYRYKNRLSSTAALLLAISPWHLQFSRVAFETNAALFFNLAAAYFFVSGLSKPKVLFISALLFGLAPYAYHSSRVFTPLLILGLLIIYFRETITLKKYFILAGCLLFFIEIPLFIILASPQGRLRIKGVSILADQTKNLARDVVKIEDDQKNSVLFPKIIHNRRITYTLLIIDGYLRHFDLKWLFLDGDNPRHHAPGMGLLYLWEMPFLLYGIYKLAFFHDKKTRNIIFWWFLIAPIAASPTTELPHSVRTLTFLPTFQILTAFGIASFIEKFSLWTVQKKTIILPYVFFIIFNIIYYFHEYYKHLSVETSQYWQYGYKEIVDFVKKEYKNYDKIIVSKKLEEPHMFFLFYLKYDPRKYLEEGGTTPGGFAKDFKKFDKFEFRLIDENKEKFDGRTLFIGTPRELTLRFKSIFYLNGTEMARIVRN